MGLSLSLAQTTILEKASYQENRGINAISGEFLNFVPFWGHIEVKRPYQSTDPLVQLGVSCSAEFSKREWERYDDISTPLIAIAIDADYWQMWIVYPFKKDGSYNSCIFVGPQDIGNTRDIEGVFTILHHLCQYSCWALEEYAEWVSKVIVQLYENEQSFLLEGEW